MKNGVLSGKKKTEIDKRAERERYCRKQGEEKDVVNGGKGRKCESE